MKEFVERLLYPLHLAGDLKRLRGFGRLEGEKMTIGLAAY